MISKKQYNEAMNENWTPWGKMGMECRTTIGTSKEFQILDMYGIWNDAPVPGSDYQFNIGTIYRIHPNTPFTGPGIVPEGEVKGLSLVYNRNNVCILKFCNKLGVAEISLPSVISAATSQAFGGHLVSKILNQFSDDNSPKGV